MCKGTTLGMCTKLGIHVQIAPILSVICSLLNHSGSGMPGSGIPWALRGLGRKCAGQQLNLVIAQSVGIYQLQLGIPRRVRYDIRCVLVS